MRSFDEFRGYQDGWGGEGEPAPPAWSLDAAERLRLRIEPVRCARQSATLNHGGWAAIELEDGHDWFIVEFEKPGEAVWCARKRGEWTEGETPLPDGEDALVSAIAAWAP